MRYLLPFLIFFLCISCEKKTTTVIIDEPIVSDQFTMNDFAGKVFKISSHVNQKDCTVYSDGCDCCEGKIVFLEDGRFVSDFYCIPYDDYDTGTYTVENGRVLLNHHALTVSLGPADEEDMESKDTLMAKSGKAYQFFLEISDCGKKPILKAKSDEGHYAEDKTTSVKEAVNAYKESGVWELLGLH